MIKRSEQSRQVTAFSVLAVLLSGCADKRPPLPPEPQLNEMLVQAAAGNRLTEVEDLIRRGADVNYTRGMDGGGMTSLLFAAREGYLGVARALVDAGADVNARQGGDASGKTPLLEGAAANHLEIVTLLLQHGAQPNVRFGYPGILPTPLHYAAQNGHHEAVRLLIMYGAVVERHDHEIAISEGHPEVLRVLVLRRRGSVVALRSERNRSRTRRTGATTCPRALGHDREEV